MLWKGDPDYTHSDFRGGRTISDRRNIPAPFAIRAQNVRLDVPRRVGPRAPFVSARTINAAVRSLWGWLNSKFSGVMMYRGDRWFLWIPETGVEYEVAVQAGGSGGFLAEFGLRAFLSLFGNDRLGIGHVFVVDNTQPFIIDPTADTAFGAPSQLVPAMSTLSGGLCTEGTHMAGYILGYRSGFATNLSPVDGSNTFTPVQVVVSGTNRTIRMVWTSPFPGNGANQFTPVLSPAGNTTRFYRVPNVSVGFAPGQTGTVQAVISISDSTLAQAQNSADLYQTQMTQDQSGNPPFRVSVIFQAGKRMVYIADNVAYISEYDDPQRIIAGRGLVFLPGQRRIVTGGVLGRLIIWLGDSWTYGSMDNGQSPVSWAEPAEIHDAMGTPSPHGFARAANGAYAWIANPEGLWYFDGRYADLPVSYLNNPEWKRINWTQPAKVRVIDTPGDFCVRVLAPLDGATEITHILTWYYLRGHGPSDVDFSLDHIENFQIGAAANIRHEGQRDSRFFVAQAGPGDILNTSRTGIADAGNRRIAAVYAPGIMPPAKAGRKVKFQAFRANLRGQGVVRTVVRNENDSLMWEVRPVIDLGPAGGGDPLDIARGVGAIDDMLYLEFATESPDQYWELSELGIYAKPLVL